MVSRIREFCEHRCCENRTFVVSVIGITFMRLPRWCIIFWKKKNALEKYSRIVPCCSLVQTEPTVNFQQNLPESTYYRKLGCLHL